MDFDGLGRLLDQITTRVGAHSRVWVGGWLASILGVTVLAVTHEAPTAAYLILLVVALAVLLASPGPGRPS
jgi:hypothetical protein